jgi:hypothetical protein
VRRSHEGRRDRFRREAIATGTPTTMAIRGSRFYRSARHRGARALPRTGPSQARLRWRPCPRCMRDSVARGERLPSIYDNERSYVLDGGLPRNQIPGNASFYGCGMSLVAEAKTRRGLR